MLLLSADLDVLGQTRKRRSTCGCWCRRMATGRRFLPAPTTWPPSCWRPKAGVDPNPPWARVHLPGRWWLTLRAARIGNAESGQDRDIAVTIEQTSPGDRVALFARSFAFSPRESELAAHLASGADTAEIARRMFLSEHTVQDHLKSIFAKTSTHSRRALLALALGG